MTISAFTANGLYPPFINISEDGDNIRVVIRSNPDGEREGTYASIVLTLDQFHKLFSDAAAHLELIP